MLALDHEAVFLKLAGIIEDDDLTDVAVGARLRLDLRDEADRVALRVLQACEHLAGAATSVRRLRDRRAGLREARATRVRILDVEPDDGRAAAFSLLDQVETEVDVVEHETDVIRPGALGRGKIEPGGVPVGERLGIAGLDQDRTGA